jgi:hypothetical protein
MFRYERQMRPDAFPLLLFNPQLSVGELWEKASADNCVYVMPRSVAEKLAKNKRV